MTMDILLHYSFLMPPYWGEQKGALPVRLSIILLNSVLRIHRHITMKVNEQITYQEKGSGAVLKLTTSVVEELISFFCPEGVKRHYWLGKLCFP